MSPRFGIRIPRARVVVLDVAGDLRADGRIGVRGLHALAAVVLNLTEVDYMDSSGIALLVGLLARARRDGRELSAYGLSEHYREIFAVTRLSDFIHVYDDEPSAVGNVPAAT